jgi:PAS domain S-box-containing protein
MTNVFETKQPCEGIHEAGAVGEGEVGTQELLDRISLLNGLLRDRDNTIQSVREGDIDAVLLDTDAGDYQLYTLQSIDRPFQAFVKQMREGAVTLNKDGIIVYGNASLADMLGVTEGHIIGQPLQRFLVPGDVPIFVQMLDQAEHGGSRSEFTLSSDNADEIPVYISLNFLRHTENATLLCGVVTDLSEQKSHLREMVEANANLVALAADLKQARDVAEQANEAKTQFLTGISHELRTPLNGILGYTQLLRLDEGLNASHMAKIDAMADAGTHLLEMINGVLNLSEIEADHVKVVKSLTNLRNIADACLDLVRPTATEKGLLLNLSVAHSVPLQILADPVRLRQVLLNLLGNAVKFTEQGSVDLRLQADGTRLRIEVIDTGCGIPVDQQHRLFREFERLSTGAAGRIEGAGLGLALSARLAVVMGGCVGYDGNPGGGSIFWLELPLSSTDGAPVPVPNPEPLQHVAAPTNPLRVLVVDDIAMNRDVADAFLRVAGHLVVCASDGREALTAVSAEDFDIVLMDVRMPEMDGLEATRRIRALKGPRGGVPILALTAQAFSGQVEECLKAGMDDHLGKPLTLNLLLDTVRRVAAAGRRAPVDVPASMIVPVGPTPTLEPVVLNCVMFKATAAALTQEAVAVYLAELVSQCQALLRGLSALGRSTNKAALGDAAHALAGSAGLFGFEQLAAAGRHFDDAAQKDVEELPALAKSFCAVMETALEEMHRAMVVGSEPRRTAAGAGSAPSPATTLPPIMAT